MIISDELFLVDYIAKGYTSIMLKIPLRECFSLRFVLFVRVGLISFVTKKRAVHQTNANRVSSDIML